MQFLCQAPIGLVQTAMDGEITMINPMSAQLLMPLTLDGDLRVFSPRRRSRSTTSSSRTRPTTATEDPSRSMDCAFTASSEFPDGARLALSIPLHPMAGVMIKYDAWANARRPRAC
jgi:hypothetical protein